MRLIWVATSEWSERQRVATHRSYTSTQPRNQNEFFTVYCLEVAWECYNTAIDYLQCKGVIHLCHNFFLSGVNKSRIMWSWKQFFYNFTLKLCPCFLFVLFYLTPLFRVFPTHLNVIYDARGVSIKTIQTKDAFWWHPKVAWGHGSCCLHF